MSQFSHLSNESKDGVPFLEFGRTVKLTLVSSLIPYSLTLGMLSITSAPKILVRVVHSGYPLFYPTEEQHGGLAPDRDKVQGC
jgi:hypothetical protein